MGKPGEREIAFRLTRHFKGKVRLLGARLIGEAIRLDIHGHDISLSMPDAETIQGSMSVSADQALLDELERVGIDGDKLEKRWREPLAEIHNVLGAAIERLLFVIKFYLDEELVSETQLRRPFGWEWSVAGKDWRYGPARIEVGGVDVVTVPGYQGNLTSRVEAAVSGANLPLLIHAMRHLHRAKLERDPRFRWIDATIAAELGIKEFLSTYKPELESLLLQVPSPPLNKLYGAVLENYAGERSPKLKAIREGVELRNVLVHRPGEQQVGSKEANAYVKNIESALLHLLTLLYPDDDLIRYRYDVLSQYR